MVALAPVLIMMSAGLPSCTAGVISATPAAWVWTLCRCNGVPRVPPVMMGWQVQQSLNTSWGGGVNVALIVRIGQIDKVHYCVHTNRVFSTCIGASEKQSFVPA